MLATSRPRHPCCDQSFPAGPTEAVDENERRHDDESRPGSCNEQDVGYESRRKHKKSHGRSERTPPYPLERHLNQNGRAEPALKTLDDVAFHRNAGRARTGKTVQIADAIRRPMQDKKMR